MSHQPGYRRSQEHSEKANRFVQELVELQNVYPKLGLQQFDNLISASQYLLLYRLIHKILPAGSRILDWGCGNGHFSKYLIQDGFAVFVYSLENLPPLLAQADNQLYEFVQGKENDPVSIPFPGSSFDAVVSVGVLEHVRETLGDETASLAEIRRILRPGGYFVGYHIPNVFSWIEAISGILPEKHSHRWRYRKTDLRQILKNTGFVNITMRRYGFLPRWLSVRYPAWLKNSSKATDFYNRLDTCLGRLFPIFCTNFAVTAQKFSGE